MRIRFLSTAAAATRRYGAVPLHALRMPPSQPHPNGRSLPPVVLIHGVMASESTYRSLQRRPDFAPFREKIGIDLRNHGMSPRVNADEMSYEAMADDVVSLLDTLDIPSACIVGHSMGGKVAMQLALTQSERVSDLVVVDIAPVTYKWNGESDSVISARAMSAMNMDDVASRKDVDEQLEKLGVTSKPLRQFLLTSLVREQRADTGGGNSIIYRWKPNVHAIADALPNIMSFPKHDGASYDGRTCVIRGGKSHYVPFQAMREFTKLFPKTKLVTISEAGHWVQAQMPDEFCRSVNDFLDD